MAFDINVFKAKVSAEGGMLKANRFLVNITPPNGMLNGTATVDATGAIVGTANGGATKTASIIEYFAEACSLPGISLQTSEIRRQGIGNSEKAVWGASFTDLDITFRIDQKTQIWKFFKDWLEMIYAFDISSGTLHELEYKNNFTTTITVFVYAENFPEKPIITVDFQDAFPISLPDISLNWGATDVINMPIRFNYRSWNVKEDTNFNVNLPRVQQRVDREVNPSGIYLGPSENAIQSDIRGLLYQSTNIFITF